MDGLLSGLGLMFALIGFAIFLNPEVFVALLIAVFHRDPPASGGREP